MATDPGIDWSYYQTGARNVVATCCFRAGPGREQEAAEAWAFELTYYFTRGVGEPPAVVYRDGVYIVTGLMQTTHPGDAAITNFSRDEPMDLDSCMRPARQRYLRALYKHRPVFFDGRDHS